jgi:hypothetical protein
VSAKIPNIKWHMTVSMTAHTHGAPAEFILQAPVDTFDRGSVALPPGGGAPGRDSGPTSAIPLYPLENDVHPELEDGVQVGNAQLRDHLRHQGEMLGVGEAR